jgi:tetratricopeptide (TPR) repeat protein
VTLDLDSLRARTDQALLLVQGVSADAELASARDLVEELRNARQYPQMLQLAEAISRRFPDDARNRRLYGQALIEQGMATVAIDVLKPLTARLPQSDPEQAEASGLLGRAYKQIFFDAGDKTSAGARAALKQAIAIYRKPFEANPANTWHGVNLVALLTRARRLGLQVAKDLQPDAVARSVVAQLNAVAPEKRDEWHLPTLAEASLGLNDWNAVEAALKRYVADEKAQPFQIASTLRQFTQVWDIEAVDARGRALADILRARLLELSRGELTLSPAGLQRAREQPDPPLGQLEAVLGANGAKTWSWWKKGLERAASVCSIRAKLGDRMGTGWLVRAGSLNREPADELLVMTNFHVVNAQGAYNGVTADAAEIVFEAVDAAKVYAVKEIAWSSPPDQHDCTVLRLAEPVTGVTPLPLAAELPLLDASARQRTAGP